jgi:iron complex outermembrane receptor protein
VLNHETQKLFSQEFRLESDPAKRLSYVAGLYYLHDMVKLTRNYDYRPPFVILGALGNLGLGINSYSELETNTYAAFGNVQYDILDNLELSFGLRYSGEQMRTLYDQAEFFRTLGLPTNQVLPLGPTGGVLIANAPRYEDDRSDALWSGTATLTYHFDDERMIYARYARGTKSGGYNLEPLPNPLPPDRSFARETLDNYEVGAKTQWWDNRLRLNLTAFYQQYHDLQRADLIPIEIAPGVFGATRVIRNAAEVEAKGVEVSAEVAPIEGLTLHASYGYSSATYTEFVLLNGTDLSGTDLTGVPKWNASIGADYVHPVGNGFLLFAGASADIRGKRLLGQADAVALGVAGYHVINGYVGFGPETGRWELRAWANNLTDERYVTVRGALTDFYNADLVGYGMPRTFGVSLKFRFGS